MSDRMSDRAAATGDTTPVRPDDVDSFLEHWRRLHGGVDPRSTLLVRRWLTAVHACARPLARRRVRPDVLTAFALVLALATVPAAVAGGCWPVLVAALTAASAVLDSLDGAVAVLSSRVTLWGALLDAVSDRCADVALTLALALLVSGAEEPVVSAGLLTALAACAIVLPLLHEYVRARAAALSMRGLELVTAAERPSRVIVVMMFALATGVTANEWWAVGGLSLLAASPLTGTLWLVRRLHAQSS
jgi:CDP-diacylglycerol--glycerol-3-phosphate 3-phosphatidyltransferase